MDHKMFGHGPALSGGVPCFREWLGAFRGLVWCDLSFLLQLAVLKSRYKLLFVA